MHGNLTALTAVLEAVGRAGIARGAFTGDLVMRGPCPAGCIRLVRTTGWPAVAGNTDRRVALEPPRPLSHPATARVGSRSWTRRGLSDGDLDWLAALPLVVHLDLGLHRVAVVHGAPDDPTTAPGADTPDDELVALARSLGADIVVTGHTHVPFVRRAGGHLFVNPGSVGEGRADDRRPAWAWLGVDRDGLQAHLERLDEPLASIRD